MRKARVVDLGLRVEPAQPDDAAELDVAREAVLERLVAAADQSSPPPLPCFPCLPCSSWPWPLPCSAGAGGGGAGGTQRMRDASSLTAPTSCSWKRGATRCRSTAEMTESRSCTARSIARQPSPDASAAATPSACARHGSAS